MITHSSTRLPWAAFVALAAALLVQIPLANAGQIDIPAPSAGNIAFGSHVRVLPNGNFVVTDPEGPINFIGAVYLYSPTGALISVLTGSTASDRVGSGGIVVLASGNFVVRSPNWDNADTGNGGAGAVTWVNGATGLTGVVSASNSLVGTSANDHIGINGVVALRNGHYVVLSKVWDNGASSDAGAVTWGNGNIGIVGAVSSGNSLVGTTAFDSVGSTTGCGACDVITELTNGNYVVTTTEWNNGGAQDAGAVTLCPGAAPCVGAVSISNSLVGSSSEDSVGSGGVHALSNGHYVVGSTSWDNATITDAGAITWGNGVSGTNGTISAGNSLLGSSVQEFLSRITVLSNGHYVVSSPFWDNGALLNVGAVTWRNGSVATSGSTATLSASNALIGGSEDDRVGSEAVIALSNGHYVVISPIWDNPPAINAGAVAWGNGDTGSVGLVSGSNALIGTSNGDLVGSAGAIALNNGHYVVLSPHWNNAAIVDAGAATWRNGNLGVFGSAGVVSLGNSLVGSSNNDQIGIEGSAVALSNGNYVVASPLWDNGASTDVGAVTWRSGTTASPAAVSAVNSMIGTTASDQVGSGGIQPLPDAHYVISSPLWNRGSVLAAGAVTRLNGGIGPVGATVGSVSVGNSLVGSLDQDRLGSGGVFVLDDSRFVVVSPEWNFNFLRVNTGAISLGEANAETSGDVDTDNSVLGDASNGGADLVWDYDETRKQLVVGRPADNRVTLFDSSLFRNGFE
jgi:hypothetical protein